MHAIRGSTGNVVNVLASDDKNDLFCIQCRSLITARSNVLQCTQGCSKWECGDQNSIDDEIPNVKEWDAWWDVKGGTRLREGRVRTAKDKVVAYAEVHTVYAPRILPGVRIAFLCVFHNTDDQIYHTSGDAFYAPIGDVGTYAIVDGSHHVRLRPARPLTGPTKESMSDMAAATEIRPIDTAAMHFLDRFHREKFTQVDPMIAPKRRWVQAPAGSGKTTFLLNIAKSFPAKRFLLITFSATLSRDVRRRVRALGASNLEVRTMDSLCLYASGCHALNTSEHDTLALSDGRIVKNFFPKMVHFGWYKKKGARDIASVCEMVLRSTVDLATVDYANLLCDYHSQISPDYVIDGMWGGSEKKRRMWSYAGNRYTVWHSQSSLLPDDSPIDCVLVDEVQDLDKQAIDIVERCSQPVIYVGDPNQEIFTFRNDNLCRGCRESIPTERHELFPPEQTVALYATFRVGAPSVDVLRSLYFSRTLVYSSSETGEGIQFCKDVPIDVPHACFLFRGNVELCEFAINHPSLVTRSEQLVWSIDRLRKSKSKRKFPSAFDRYVLQQTDDQIEKLKSALAVNEFACDTTRAACTVHSAKGAEYDTVAVPYTLFSNLFAMNVSMDERRIAWVACTRHRTKLIVYGWFPDQEKEEPPREKKRKRVQQTTLDHFIL